MFLIGISTSILQPSVFGFSSQLPELFNQAIMAGQGVAGAGVSFMRLATKGFVPNPMTSALLFFSISCFVMIVCVFGYYALLKMEFTQYHLSRSVTTRKEHAAARTPVQGSKSYNGQDDDDAYVPPLPSSMERGVSTPGSDADSFGGSLTPGRQLKRKFTLRVFLSKRLGLRNRTPKGETLLADADDDEFGGACLGSCAPCMLAVLTSPCWAGVQTPTPERLPTSATCLPRCGRTLLACCWYSPSRSRCSRVRSPPSSMKAPSPCLTLSG